MPEYDFDLLTIDAGSGGVTASRRAASYGARVAICENSRIGGTCVIRGCVPKKLLMYGSQFPKVFDDAACFCWTVEPPVCDWSTQVAAKDGERERLKGIYRKLLASLGVTSLEGRGKVMLTASPTPYIRFGTRATVPSAQPYANLSSFALVPTTVPRTKF